MNCKQQGNGAEAAMKAEYTLQQAIALVNLNVELLHRHLTSCKICMEFYDEFCEDGERLIQNRLK